MSCLSTCTVKNWDGWNKRKYGDGNIQGDLQGPNCCPYISHWIEEAILIQMEEVMSYFKIKINKQKVKVMKCSNVEKGIGGGVRLELDQFYYLGNTMAKDN